MIARPPGAVYGIVQGRVQRAFEIDEQMQVLSDSEDGSLMADQQNRHQQPIKCRKGRLSALFGYATGWESKNERKFYEEIKNDDLSSPSSRNLKPCTMIQVRPLRASHRF